MSAPSTVTYSVAFQQGVREEMARDASILIMGTDIYDRGGHWAQVKGLGPEFGRDRVRDTPISEAAMVAAGVGAAMSGARPIVDLNFADFALGAMDEIVNQAAKIRYMWGRNVPLVIRGTSGVALAGAHHNNSLETTFAAVPGLAVVTPSNPRDVKGLIKSALRGEDPVIFLMHKKLTGVRGEIGDGDELVPIGSAARPRQGDDVTIVSYGYGVVTATTVADELRGEGVAVDVIDLRTLAPLDRETVLASVRRTGRAVVLDEAPGLGGIAAQVAAIIQEHAFWYLDAPVLTVTSPVTPIPHSPELVDEIVPSAADLGAAVRRVLGR
jgi:pyruvate dehydrogenase E1 component beta subunit